MTLSTAAIAQLLVALTLLVVAAHAVGGLFARLRQPPVIGEILGGLLLGPTVLGALSPGLGAAVFPEHGVTPVVLGAVYQLGLLLLMFLAGAEVRVQAEPGERATVVAATVIGVALPFVVGLGVSRLLDHTRFSGPDGSAVTFTLIFGIAIAVSSIPVISRILLDLGILDTAFARVVLSIAVLQDIVLYVVLGVTLGLVQAQSGESFGLWALTGVDNPGWSAAYYVVVTLGYIGVFLSRGARLFEWLAAQRLNLLERRNPTAARLVFLLLAVMGCVALGINPIFGALVAGVSAARADTAPVGSGEGARARHAWEALRHFSLAFFIPVYFAIVGLQLDLARDLDVVFFAWFFVFACAATSFAVWLGARLAGQDNTFSVNLAVALNARGGPGIVLASVTFAAGVINERFFTALVLLAILSSQFAGFWLDRVYHRKPGLAPVLRAPQRSWFGQSRDP